MRKNNLKVVINGAQGHSIEKQVTPHHYRILLNVEETFILKSATLEIPYTYTNEKVLLNGFQTWSSSMLVPIRYKDQNISRIFNKLQGKYGDYQLTSYEFLHSWSYTYLKADNYCRVIGSLNEENAFHIIEFDVDKSVIRLVLDVDELIIEAGTFELFNIYDESGNSERVVTSYFDELDYESRLDQRKYYGWTSWYQYYTDINEDIILKHLKEFYERSIALDYFQIDDGYQKRIGDWLQMNKDFPRGMSVISDEIHKAGFKAGLWIAPFICEKNSKIFKSHKKWLIKDKKGRPVKIGYNPSWSGYYYGLDIRLTEVKNYLRNVFNTVINEWGYNLLKLDFLFAVTLIDSKEKTRGQIMREAMVFIKEISHGAHIIACGVPLASVYGLVEFSRVSCDVGLKWEDQLMKWFSFKERVSTINAIETSIGREHMNHKVFINDPDVFILRDENQKMTFQQRKTLLFVNLIFGGLIFTSDTISCYTKEQMALYHLALKFKNSKVINIEKNELIYVEVALDKKNYLFIINIDNKKHLLKLHKKWQQSYLLDREEIAAYESFFIEK